MLLRIDKLTKEYGKNSSYQKVLDNINIEFKSGEFVCILGESGSGKSTLLNIIGGLDNKYDGSVNINNLNLKYINLDEYRNEKIGFIFQNFNLINSLSVIDNIIVPIDKYNLSYSYKRRKAISLMRKLNIYSIKRKKINELSGGQKQRVAIARALIGDPEIILADEPTGSLDEFNSKTILEILKDINKEGKLVIVVTHSEKVIDYSTRVITIKDGKIYKDKKIKRVKETVIDKDEVKHSNFFYLIKYGIRNIINNKRRNIFISLASSIGIVGIILSLFLGGGVKEYMKSIILDKANPLIYNITRKDNNLYSEEEINNIKNIKHIKELYEEKTYSLSSLNINDNKYELVYVDSFNKIELEKGNDKGLIISKYLYDELNDKNIIGKKIKLSVIDDFKVIDMDLNISGVSKNSGISLVDNTYHGFIKYDLLKNIYDSNSIKMYPNNISILIDNKVNIDYVKDKLSNINFDSSNNNELYDELSSYLNIAIFVLSMFSSLSLIVSIIMISIIISITVLERTKEIGILRSIGYSKKNIRNIFYSESILIGIFIGLLSIIISSRIIKFTGKILTNKFNITFNINPNKYYFLGLILSIILLLVASYFPSKKASNQDPINSLRYE